jgi:pimeloyl-ACP methyl ester carboxylesterase
MPCKMESSRPIPLAAAGRRLEAYWIGPPPGASPTLVFLHEGLGSARAWLSFAESVSAATRCGALVYSRAGYGSSDPTNLTLPVRFMHDEALIVLPEILDTAGIEEAILIGHSDGASIALIHAAGPGSGRIRALVLEAPHSFVEPVTVASTVALLERFHGDLRRKLERLHGENTERIFHAWTDVWLRPEFASWSIEDLLPAVTCPVLVIQGEQDEYGTVRQVEAVTDKVQGSVEALLLPGCGHAPHRDRREETLGAIVRFVNLQKGSAGAGGEEGESGPRGG